MIDSKSWSNNQDDMYLNKIRKNRLISQYKWWVKLMNGNPLQSIYKHIHTSWLMVIESK